MAQLDSASDSDSEGRWFESSRAYQQKALAKVSAFCFNLGKGGFAMALENKLGLTSSADLAREEERISKKKSQAK